MIASLFFRAGGTVTEFDVNPVVGKFKISEGIKLSLPCVQTALFFTQEVSGDSSVADDDSDSGSFLPQNWGIRVFSTGKESSVSPPSSYTCEFSVGRISVSGPLSELKQPVPAFGKRWNVKQPAAIKVKGGLPDVDDGKKPLSVCVSLDTGVFFAGFAAVALEESARSLPQGAGLPAHKEAGSPTAIGAIGATDATSMGGTLGAGAGRVGCATESGAGRESSGAQRPPNPTAPGATVPNSTYAPTAPRSSSATGLGADILLAQFGFFPDERNGLRFYTNCTFAAASLDATETSRWFLINAFHPADTRFLFLNDTVLTKDNDTLKISVQNSFVAGISRHKSQATRERGMECWNNTLLCLSCSWLYASMGIWFSDFGFTTASGTDLRTPLRLYGSVAFSFSAVGAKFDIYGSCMTGTTYAETLPAEKRVETSVRVGVSASFSDFSVSADGAVKNLCPQDEFTKAALETSLSICYEGGSLQWNAEIPLVFLPSDDSAFKWGISVKPPADWMNGFSGSVSGKFCGMEFSAFECNASFSTSISSAALKFSAGISVSASKKLTWSLSAQIKL